MFLAAAETTENWPEAAIAIAGIALVGSVIIVAVWQLLATWRTRMLGSRETEYRQLAQQSLEAQARSAAALEQVLAELRSLREHGEREA
jgi:Tfp pilus assembly protein PilO